MKLWEDPRVVRGMRAQLVVLLAKPRQGAPKADQRRRDADPAQAFSQRAMEPLDLALGLRMIRPPVQDPHAQSQQPDGQRSMPDTLRDVAPRRSIVAEDRIGQTIALETY